jgi:acetylornithine aminotransferase
MHGSNLYHNEWSGELAQLLVESTFKHGGLGFAPSSPAGPTGLKVFFASTLNFVDFIFHIY